MTQKVYSIDKFFCHHHFFLLKNKFKVALQNHFNVFMLFRTVFNLKLLKIDQICVFLKTWKKLRKNEWQPLIVINNSFTSIFFVFDKFYLYVTLMGY